MKFLIKSRFIIIVTNEHYSDQFNKIIISPYYTFLSRMFSILNFVQFILEWTVLFKRLTILF